MKTYAQNFEDVMLARLFAGKLQGFYIDIGANHPSDLSVTKYFYDLGWRGINIEPISNNCNALNKERPNDINLQVAVGKIAGQRIFYEVMENNALSTFDHQRAENLKLNGYQINSYPLEIVTLKNILEKYSLPEVDFLKIDVEGSELDIISSTDFSIFRPTVIVIESTSYTESFPGWQRFDVSKCHNHEAWEKYLLNSGYIFSYFDGLNRFYIREESKQLCARLTIPPGVFDYIVPDMLSWSQAELVEKERVIQELLSPQTLAATVRQLQALVDLQRVEKEQFIQEQATNQQLVEMRAKFLKILETQLVEKEQVIQELQTLVDLQRVEKEQFMQDQATNLRLVGMRTKFLEILETQLVEKEQVIQEQAKALRAYRKAVISFLPFFRPYRVLANRLQSIVRPRIGNLSQYAPRSLTYPASNKTSKFSASVPKISIVTPSFQQGGYIERTLKSVLDQGYPNLEYFVQDGASNDQTVSILQTYEQQLSGWRSEKDSGQSQAINLGFANTTGEIMAWLNSDDLLLPGALACISNYFSNHPEVDVVYGNRLLIDENDMEIGRWVLPGHDSKVLSWADYVPQETLFWRRSIWDKAGGQINEVYRFAMDWELLVRFRDAGARFAHIPRFLGAFRIHSHQKTSASINDVGFKEMNQIREHILGRIPSRKEIRKAVTPFMLRHLAVDLAHRIKMRMGGKR